MESKDMTDNLLCTPAQRLQKLIKKWNGFVYSVYVCFHGIPQTWICFLMCVLYKIHKTDTLAHLTKNIQHTLFYLSWSDQE